MKMSQKYPSEKENYRGQKQLPRFDIIELPKVSDKLSFLHVIQILLSIKLNCPAFHELKVVSEINYYTLFSSEFIFKTVNL